MRRGMILNGVLSAGMLLGAAGWASADCDGGRAKHPDMGMHRGMGMMPPDSRAGGRREWRRDGRQDRWMDLRSKLNLTAEQRQKIQDVVQSFQDQKTKARQELRDKWQALQDKVRADKPNEKAIRAAADDLAKAIGDRALLKSKIHTQVRGVLTDEQRKQLDQVRQEHRQMIDRSIDNWLMRQSQRPEPGRPERPEHSEHH